MNVVRVQLASVLAGVLVAGIAQADGGAAQGPVLRPGLQELADAELAGMRGRYTLGGNNVAWFGVTMISQWQTAAGSNLNAAMRVGFDMRGGAQPKVSFLPSVQVVSGAEADPAVGPARQVDSAGLANVDGLVQSVQLAGDGSQVSNQAQVVVRSGEVPDWGSGTATGAGQASARDGAASATAWANGQRAGVQLQLVGHGQVSQWLGQGALGQSVALATDGSWVSNRLQLEVVRAGQGASTPLAQNVAQAIGSSRGLGMGRF